MVKKMTLGAIKKEDKRFDERFTVVVQGYTLEIDRNFRSSKISQMIAELVEGFEQARIYSKELGEIFTPYAVLLMIKHFTSLDVPNKLDEQLAVLDLLDDGDLLMPIYNELPKDQVDLVFNEIEKVTKRLNDNIMELLSKTDELDLDNRELLGLEFEEEDSEEEEV